MIAKKGIIMDDNKEMKEFSEKWCKDRNLDICNLTDEQMNKLCSSWAVKCLGIPFKTMEEWRKERDK